MSLWNFFQSEYALSSPQGRMDKIPQDNQRASFYICQRASYTVEAAVVIPLLAGYLVMLLSFFRIIQVQCAVDEALMYAGRKTAVESSIVDSQEALLLSAEGYLLYALKENPLVEKQLVHGLVGIQLWESKFDGETIILKAKYVVELPIHFFGIRQVELSSQNQFRKWNTRKTQERDGGIVYVTPTGEVYHVDRGCRSLNLSVRDIGISEVAKLRGANGQRYNRCTRCNWTSDKKERVYYTDYGTLYHRSVSCSALKRTIVRLSIEEIGERRPCKWCSR